MIFLFSSFLDDCLLLTTMMSLNFATVTRTNSVCLSLYTRVPNNIPIAHGKCLAERAAAPWREFALPANPQTRKLVQHASRITS